MHREAGATETHQTSVLHTGNDLVFGLKLEVADNIQRGIDSLVPVVAFALDDHGGFLIAGDVGNHIHLGHGAGDGGMDVGAHEGGSLADELSNLHLVALLHNGVGGGAEVLGHENHCLIGQRESLHRCGVGYLVRCGVHTAHGERFALEATDGTNTLFNLFRNLLGYIFCTHNRQN